MRSIVRFLEEQKVFRMVGWLPVGVLFYAVSVALGTEYPQWQTLFWKLGHACTFSWVGYWVARQTIGRLDIDGRIDTIPEAIIFGCGIVGRAIIVAYAFDVARGL